MLPGHRFAAVLLTLLVISGGVHAQVLYACELLSAPAREECCCSQGARAQRDAGEQDPCCKRIVELRLDPGAEYREPVLKPTEVRLDVGPLVVVAIQIPIPAPLVGEPALLPRAPAEHSSRPGTRTYLLTERLRI